MSNFNKIKLLNNLRIVFFIIIQILVTIVIFFAIKYNIKEYHKNVEFVNGCIEINSIITNVEEPYYELDSKTEVDSETSTTSTTYYLEAYQTISINYTINNKTYDNTIYDYKIVDDYQYRSYSEDTVFNLINDSKYDINNNFIIYIELDYPNKVYTSNDIKNMTNKSHYISNIIIYSTVFIMISIGVIGYIFLIKHDKNE